MCVGKTAGKGKDLRVRFRRAAFQLRAHGLKVIEFILRRKPVECGCVGRIRDIIGGAGKAIERKNMGPRPRGQQFRSNRKIFVSRTFNARTCSTRMLISKRGSLRFDHALNPNARAGTGSV